ncbi:MAG TPA: hypothetical protein VK991_12130 [Halomonas sp.]|nr:hypothetical protein [Halomonas sp.]
MTPSVIDQLNNERTRAFAQYCYEKSTEKKLRDAAAADSPDRAELAYWRITKGEWQEAMAAALADMEFEKNPPAD